MPGQAPPRPGAPVTGPWPTDAERQAAARRWLAEGRPLTVGDGRALPRAPAALRRLAPGDAGVFAVVDGGLTGRVLGWQQGDARWAVKQVWPASRVHNADGETAFVNELLRHRELADARDAGVPLPGILHAVYGDLALGLLVTPWVDGGPPDVADARALAQLFDTGVHLHLAGHFEWDWSPGNLLDDGRQVWLFDFGYQYRFDPLARLHSGGDAAQAAHHLVERLGSRWAHGALLQRAQTHGDAAAVQAFGQFQALGIAAMRRLAAALAGRGAVPAVPATLRAWADAAEAALSADPAAAWRAEAWTAHLHDVADDLQGRSCTPMTLRRLDWLAATLRDHARALAAAGRLDGRDPADWGLRLAGWQAEARRWQTGLAAPAATPMEPATAPATAPDTAPDTDASPP